MSTTFDLEKAKAWASSGVQSDKSPTRISEQTIARHGSECQMTQVINMSDLNSIKRVILESKEFENKYRNASLDKINNTDAISMRVSGKKIEHGKIKFKDGLSGMTAFYSLIRSSIDNVLGSNKNNKNNYLDSLYMLTPAAGSFIYQAEVKLFNNNESHLYYTNRCVNIELANSIKNIYNCLNSKNDYNVASLISLGIDEGICKSIIDAFTDDADEIDFNFSWAGVGEPISDECKRKIIFNRKHKDKANVFYDKLKNIKVFKLEDLPACIEKYTWLANKDFGEISLKIKYKNKHHTCKVAIDERKYIELKLLPPKSIVMISGDFSIKENGKGGVYINKLIAINKSNQNDLF